MYDEILIQKTPPVQGQRQMRQRGRRADMQAGRYLWRTGVRCPGGK